MPLFDANASYSKQAYPQFRAGKVEKRSRCSYEPRGRLPLGKVAPSPGLHSRWRSAKLVTKSGIPGFHQGTPAAPGWTYGPRRKTSPVKVSA